MGSACSAHGRAKKCFQILVVKPEGKRPFGRPRCRWEDNIKIDLTEIIFGVAGSCEYGYEPSSSIKNAEFLD
jgi:hypothetical protein